MFIERAEWQNESADVVLRHCAEAAGKVMRIDKTVQKRLKKVRVNLSMGRAPVSKVLDRILLENTAAWHVEREVIVVYDNDD